MKNASLFLFFATLFSTVRAMEEGPIPTLTQKPTFSCLYCPKSFSTLGHFKRHLELKHYASTKVRLPLKKQGDATSESLSSEASSAGTIVSQPLFQAFDRQQVVLATRIIKGSISLEKLSNFDPLVSQASPFCRNSVLTRKPWAPRKKQSQALASFAEAMPFQSWS